MASTPYLESVFDRDIPAESMHQPIARPPELLGIVLKGDDDLKADTELQFRITEAAAEVDGAVLESDVMWVPSRNGAPTDAFRWAFSLVRSGGEKSAFPQMPSDDEIRKRYIDRTIDELGPSQYRRTMGRKRTAEQAAAFPTGQVDYVTALNLLDASLTAGANTGTNGDTASRHHQGTALLMADIAEGIYPQVETKLDIDDAGDISKVAIKSQGGEIELLKMVMQVVSDPLQHYLPKDFAQAILAKEGLANIESPPTIVGSYLLALATAGIPSIGDREGLAQRAQIERQTADRLSATTPQAT